MRFGVRPGTLGIHRGGWPYPGPPNCDFTINLNSPQAKGLVAWWPLGLGQYGMLRDVVGRFHMTAFNTPQLVTDGEGGLVTQFANGSNEYLESSGAPLSSVPLTLMCWFKPTATTGLLSLFGISDGGNNYWGLQHFSSSNGQILARCRDGGGGGSFASTTTFATQQIWYHGCGVFPADDLRIAYLSGGGRGTNATAGDPVGIDRVEIADLGGEANWDGRLRDVRIYNRALFDAEVYECKRKPWELYRPNVPYVLGMAPAGGTTYYSTPAGSLSFAGAATRQAQTAKAGVLTLAGAPTKLVVPTAKAGVLTLAGAPTKQIAPTAKTGVLTLAGTPTRQTQTSKAGVLTLAGAPTRQTQTSKTGALTSAGAIAKQTQTAKAGVLTFAGAVSAIKTFLQAIAGTLSLAGTLTRRAGKLLAGTLASAGAPTKQTQTTKTGTLTTSGTLDAIRIFLQAVAGALGLAGSLVRQTGKGIGGAVTPSGAVTRLIAKALAGALSLAGSLAAALAGRVSPGPVLRAAIDELRVRAGLERTPDVRAGAEFGPEIRGGEEL